MNRAIDEEIEIHAPPERVWRAWTESEEFVTWWGEDGLYRVTSWTGDVRPGGKWRSEGVFEDGKKFWVEGDYLRVEPPEFLSFTWRHDWFGSPIDTVVSLEFRRTAGGTLLKLNHTGFPTDEACSSHSAGWTRVLGWLRTYLAPEHKT